VDYINIENLPIIISSISAIIACSSLFIARKRLSTNNEWNRRIATHNALMKSSRGQPVIPLPVILYFNKSIGYRFNT